MATSFKAADGAVIKDGDKGTFALRYGQYENVHEQMGYGVAGEPVTVEVTGTIHLFVQVELVYGEKAGVIVAVDTTADERWEIVTGDPQYPAVGFLPENLLARLK